MRNDGGEGRAIHFLERPEDQLGDRPARGRVPGREEGVGSAVAHQLHSHLDRGALLESGPAHPLTHPHDVRGVDDVDRQWRRTCAPQLVGQRSGRADQPHAGAELPAGRDRARHDDARTVVTPHRVDGDAGRERRGAGVTWVAH